MKKSVFIIAGIVLAVNFSSFAQRGRGNEDKPFYCTLAGGSSFSANGDCLSMVSGGKFNPPFLIEVGVQPRLTEYLQIGAQMGSFQISPAMVRVWNKNNPRCATLLLKVGGSFGKESLFTGGVNTSFGVGFIDVHDQLGNYPVWGLSLEGGINVTKTFSILVSNTFYYLWKGHSSMLASNGAGAVVNVGFRFRFN